MKLLWSSRSPFVRKVLIVMHELGIAADVDLWRVVVSSARVNAEVMALSPLGRIPALVLEDGSVLHDSRVIAEYLDSRHGNGTLFPPGVLRWQALRQQALADGIMETDIRWLEERDRPEAMRAVSRIEAYRAKIESALDVFETDQALDATELPTIGHLAAASALAHLDFRFNELSWRSGRPRLAAWYEAVSRRPAVRATAFSDQY